MDLVTYKANYESKKRLINQKEWSSTGPIDVVSYLMLSEYTRLVLMCHLGLMGWLVVAADATVVVVAVAQKVTIRWLCCCSCSDGCCCWYQFKTIQFIPSRWTYLN